MGARISADHKKIYRRKKIAVALQKGFYETLPISRLVPVSKSEGDIA
jgi:hypothetical protein